MPGIVTLGCGMWLGKRVITLELASHIFLYMPCIWSEYNAGDFDLPQIIVVLGEKLFSPHY